MSKSDTTQNASSDWKSIVKAYSSPNPLMSWWQIVNSVVPYIGLWVLMVYTIDYSIWLTLGLSLLASGFLVRIFIIFHDCGHGSFFKNKTLERIVGIITAFFVFTPYHKWTKQHQIHHQTVGNLDKRGVGDVKTLTVEEYKNLSKGKRLAYRLYRNPFTLFVLSPMFLFTVIMRFPSDSISKKFNWYLHLTTVALVLVIAAMIYFLGLKTFLLIQIPTIYFASAFGIWLFYAQHQFDGTVWARQDKWNYKEIALEGSSYLRLPKILQWFSGNIGFHHIHHLSGKIPNYKLEQCYRENEEFQIKGMNLWESLKAVNYHLWDEKKGRLVSFRQVSLS